MKLHITKIYKTDKDKAGNLLKTRDGRNYTRLAIQTQEHGAKWISGFMGNWNQNWKEGEEVDADVEQKGEYLNLKRIDPLEELTARVEALEKAVFSRIEQASEPPPIMDEDIPD